MRTEENIRRGMAPEEARRAAEQRFGRLTQIKELGYQVIRQLVYICEYQRLATKRIVCGEVKLQARAFLDAS